MGLKPAGIYGLSVPAGEEPILAVAEDEYPATFRITMAAIDPSAIPVVDGDADTATIPRATLKMIRLPELDDDDSDSDYDDSDMADLLDSDSDDDEEANGGPSDPSKSPKAQRRAALRAALADAREEMELDEDDLPKVKGKAKVIAGDEEDIEGEDEEDDSDMESIPEGAEELVLCTLDPLKNCQQPLDITIMEHERVLFLVSGTHDIHLTGNILYDDDDRDGPAGLYDDESDEEEYDLSPDEDEIGMELDDDEEDELDDIDDPRIEELGSDEEDEIPKLVKIGLEKGKNKRAAEDSSENTPEKAKTNGALTNGDAPLSKNQKKKLAKKMKDNAGNAIEVTHTKTADGVNGTKETIEATKTNPKENKKVQFAKTLVQGPSATNANDTKKQDAGSKPGLGKKTVQGVEIDDKKLGSGPQAKAGDRVSMRYIGKLEKDKRVFDANKKGPPFSFKLGKGEVIKGWDIGIAGMTVGGERRITIPAHLAYGSKSMPDIPANSTLVFDVKLLEIKK